jgi:hypothetical protein
VSNFVPRQRHQNPRKNEELGFLRAPAIAIIIVESSGAFCEHSSKQAISICASVIENLPRMQMSDDLPVPLTRHKIVVFLVEGCSQKALAPLATLFAPLTRRIQTSSRAKRNDLRSK